MKAKKFSSIRKNSRIIVHFLKLTQRIDKKYVPLLALSAFFKALIPFINIIMPKYILEELYGHKRINVFIILVLIIIIGNGILKLTNKALDTIIRTKNAKIIKGFNLIMGQKVMNLDFEKIEDPEILNLKELAMQPINQLSAIDNMIYYFVDIVSQLIIIIGLVGIISTMNILIVLFIIAIVLINSFILKKSQKVQYDMYGFLIPVNRHAEYYFSLAQDFSVGKEIRLYNMSSFIYNKITKFNKKSMDYMESIFSKIGNYAGITNIFVQLQSLFVYGYIAIKVVRGDISIGDFILYTTAAIKFSTSISQIFNTYVSLTQMCRYLENFLKMESISSNNTKGKSKIGFAKEYNIEFKNVYFKYPRSKDYTLKNINIKIKNGEKLSVVGLNGAGKTTFIKLLCRLYDPTEGSILLNGVDIREYDYDDYMNLLSVVFQDYKLFSFSIKENIALAQQEAAAEIEVANVLEKAGFKEDLQKLKSGINTSIYKNFDKKGIEFSGGQAQKLAMARAMYKDAPIVVLDEPTAALDPFAEFEIYSKFNELIGDKSAIFISHRLSSCRFCDNIAVFKNGEIVEYGTHEELVNENSFYNRMYQAQAQYYV
ncbi:ABC transporter ATP-binding protein [Oceanirhabdus sp. W0125-5]|uniref:ABC transporter ATP-binding protein n=1 Tax=Oceanirhabdus sp. W0125-5 TaxID=2999116 RepID=UPI0022F346AB|nr:ABC transporter ATP-binding protein [Oceanirhabdus sp. W0125-5]WBW97568.1 ABC transporter ATP-binding protein [Oceanirhabdus sp. W0125-5]